MIKIIKFICKTLSYPIGKIKYLLHKLFPKDVPILSCYGCLNDICEHRCTEYNAICYYHTKKNRKLIVESDEDENNDNIRKRNI